jgi:hypothetical protein
MRILVQESPDSELQLKRDGEKKLWGLKYKFGKVRELI